MKGRRGRERRDVQRSRLVGASLVGLAIIAWWSLSVLGACQAH